MMKEHFQKDNSVSLQYEAFGDNCDTWNTFGRRLEVSLFQPNKSKHVKKKPHVLTDRISK